jgi:5'-3' exonuclease
MLNRIKRDPAQHPRSRIAAAARHPGVRRFMDADREQKHDQLKQHVNVLQVHQALNLILTRKPGYPAAC